MTAPAPKRVVGIHGLAVGALPQDGLKCSSDRVEPVVFAALFALAGVALHKLAFVVVAMHLGEGGAGLTQFAMGTQESSGLEIDHPIASIKEKEQV